MNRTEEKDLTKRLRAAVRNFNSGTKDLRPLLRLAYRRIENLEEERGFDQMTIGGYAEIEAELVGALSRLTEEELRPCMPPCPGHLGEKAFALIRAAQGGEERLVLACQSAVALAELIERGYWPPPGEPQVSSADVLQAARALGQKARQALAAAGCAAGVGR